MKVKLINQEITSNYGVNLLKARGIENVELFLHPTKECLQSYTALNNIEKGVQLIKQVSGKIGIIVDSDADGFTSATIITQYLKRLKPNLIIEHYLHNGKGHGLEEHYKTMLDKNYDLIILPDAGSNDKQYAKLFKCPILILDHHIVETEDFSDNMVVINNQLSPLYQNKYLSGAGVVYQFCRALDDAFGIDQADYYLDLAALGIDGDMMSGLEIENQYIWKYGFSTINNYFFLTLARKQAYSLTGNKDATDDEIIASLNPTSVAFYIVPLINAMVRMGNLREKETMLKAFLDGHALIPCNKRGAKGTMEEAAIESVRECINARAHQNKFKEEAVQQLAQKIMKYQLLDNQILFIRLDEENDFPSELNGLLAMQLSQQYKRPTIVARPGADGIIRGSMRGLSYSALTSFKDYLDSTGLFDYVQGHDNAAGVAIPNGRLQDLHKLANQELLEYNLGEDYYEVNFIRQAYNKDLKDLILDLNNYKHIWSTQNKEALIYVQDLHITRSDIQIMGRNKDTVKIVKNGITYIKFFAKDMIKELNKYEDIKFEVVGKASLNKWNGTITPQIFIENYEIKEDNVLDF